MMTMSIRNNILRNIKDEFIPDWKNTLREQVARAPHIPKLCIVQVGDVEASNRYVRNKLKDCGELGIIADLQKFPEGISENDLMIEIVKLENFGIGYDGLIVQLPLPKHINPKRIASVISPNKDVDGFGASSAFNPCTPLGIMRYLRYCNFDVKSQSVLVIGRSAIVGRPMARMLLDNDATVTVCHSKTKHLSFYINNCDLIICAVGKPHFLNCYSIYVPVIDVGINFDENGKMCGDCFNTEDRMVTPVPGGVGLMTRCALIENVISAAALGGN